MPTAKEYQEFQQRAWERMRRNARPLTLAEYRLIREGLALAVESVADTGFRAMYDGVLGKLDHAIEALTPQRVPTPSVPEPRMTLEESASSLYADEYEDNDTGWAVDPTAETVIESAPLPEEHKE